jgi:hypothetical protein
VLVKTINPVVGILPKSPLPKKGRFGPESKQDWYQTCVKAAEIAHKLPEATVLISSEFQTDDEGYEDLVYRQVMQGLGVRCNRIVLLRKGLETIGHLRAMGDYANAESRELVIVHGPTHVLRVWYVCWKDGIVATYLCPWLSIPRPLEILRDIGLSFLFPALDLLGYREWFLRKLVGKRKSGSL